MRTLVCAAACALVLLSNVTATAQGTKAPKRDADVARGRYLVKIGGCNDCHTVNYTEKAGAVPENEWLTGVPVGFQGPWGTTYPTNLRLLVSNMTEERWMTHARLPMRPPMPWFALRDMTESDLRAVYRYVKSMGPVGQPAPPYVAPGGNVATPFIVFVPQNPPAPR